jgi:hypothetical protein
MTPNRSLVWPLLNIAVLVIFGVCAILADKARRAWS